MQSVEKNLSLVNSSVYKVSAFSALCMILLFTTMKLAGLVTIVELRFLNFFIMVIGVRYILLLSRKSNNGKLEYLHGMLTGFMTAFFTSVFFALFISIYLFIDSSFMNYLRATQPFGSYLTPASAALVIAIEGITSGTIFTFAMMHIFNDDNDQG